jgi:hypothetical protein
MEPSIHRLQGFVSRFRLQSDPLPSMSPIARLLLLLAVTTCVTGCRNILAPSMPASAAPVLGADALIPSARLVVGRIIAVDDAQRFAFVELAPDAPNAALIAGTQLLSRSLELRNTGHIQVSSYLRGQTLGTKIVGGQPSPGDEVVWLAP